MKVDYNASREITSQHARWAKVMTNIPRMPREKVLCQDESASRPGKRTGWRPDQKSVFSMRNPVRKFSKASDLAMHFCAGTCCTAKCACCLTNKSKFAACIVDLDLLSVAEPSLVLTHISQVLSLSPDIGRSGELEAGPKVSSDETAALRSTKKATV